MKAFRWFGSTGAAAVALVLSALASSGSPARAEDPTEAVEGTLSIVWGDPAPGVKGGATRFEIVRPDGTKVPMKIDPADQPAAFAAFGKKVVATGRREASEAGAGHFVAASIAASAGPDASATDAPAAATIRKVLYILVKFKGDTQTPHTPAFFDKLTNPTTADATLKIPATINGYFAKTSWNRLQWQGTVAGNKWFTLPKTKAQYAPCAREDACADLDGLAADAIALVKAAGVNVAAYDNLSFVVNNDLDCCAWGGSYVYGGKLFGATWEPPWGQETGTYIHEYGHSIGLPHSGWKYYAYDSPWDDMSDGSAASYLTCGTYTSANAGAARSIRCTEPGAGYITAHKDFKGWIPAANKVVISAIGTKTLDLEANALPLGTGIKMVKICIVGQACTGSTARFYTVEARLKSAQYEKGLPGEGVVVHHVDMARGPIGSGNKCFFNSQSGWAVPLDATPGDWDAATCSQGTRTFPNYALYNAQYGKGKVFTSSTYGIKVEVLDKLTTGFKIRVSRSK